MEYITKETAIKAIQGLCIEKNTPQMIWSTDAMDAVRNAPDGWISVKDEMPEDGLLNKLVFDSEGQIRICGKVATFTQGNGEKVFIPDAPIIDSLLLGAKNYEDVWKITHITHWMPLPEPPEEV